MQALRCRSEDVDRSERCDGVFACKMSAHVPQENAFWNLNKCPLVLDYTECFGTRNSAHKPAGIAISAPSDPICCIVTDSAV